MMRKPHGKRTPYNSSHNIASMYCLRSIKSKYIHKKYINKDIPMPSCAHFSSLSSIFDQINIITKKKSKRTTNTLHTSYTCDNFQALPLRFLHFPACLAVGLISAFAQAEINSSLSEANLAFVVRLSFFCSSVWDFSFSIFSPFTVRTAYHK